MQTPTQAEMRRAAAGPPTLSVVEKMRKALPPMCPPPRLDQLRACSLSPGGARARVALVQLVVDVCTRRFGDTDKTRSLREAAVELVKELSPLAGKTLADAQTARKGRGRPSQSTISRGSELVYDKWRGKCADYMKRHGGSEEDWLKTLPHQYVSAARSALKRNTTHVTRAALDPDTVFSMLSCKCLGVPANTNAMVLRAIALSDTDHMLEPRDIIQVVQTAFTSHFALKTFHVFLCCFEDCLN